MKLNSKVLYSTDQLKVGELYVSTYMTIYAQLKNAILFLGSKDKMFYFLFPDKTIKTFIKGNFFYKVSNEKTNEDW